MLYLAVVLATAFFCCKEKTAVDKASALVSQRQAQYDVNVLPEIKLKLKEGDIIFRLGTDITSYLFATLNDKDKRFSHCGIVNFEDNQWYVYHAIGGELNPDETLRREPLEWFAAPDKCKSIGLFVTNLSLEERKYMLGIVKGWHQMKLTFDMQFDLATNDKMYCTEMVAKALIVTKNDFQWLAPTQKGGILYYSTENLTLSNTLKQKGYWNY